MISFSCKVILPNDKFADPSRSLVDCDARLNLLFLKSQLVTILVYNRIITIILLILVAFESINLRTHIIFENFCFFLVTNLNKDLCNYPGIKKRVMGTSNTGYTRIYPGVHQKKYYTF